ncbi:MAG: radical SAM protein [bacterium]
MNPPFFPESQFSPSFAEPDNDPTQVEYIELKVKTALRHARLPYGPQPFHYSLNLYRGCRHGCPYCFARYTHWFLGFQNSFDFQRKIQVKRNVLEVLERELSHAQKRRDWVSLGAVTDPYQPAEKKYQLTRGALKLFARHAWPVVFSTKSDLVLRDLDVLREVTDRSHAGVAITLTTLNPDLQKFLEPHAVPIHRRLEALRQLKAQGIPCGIHFMPIIPFLTDDNETLEAMVKTAKELDVDYLYANLLRLRGQVVRGYYFQSLKARNRNLWEKTVRLYGNQAHPDEAYRTQLYARLEGFRQKWNFKNRWSMEFRGEQLEFLN